MSASAPPSRRLQLAAVLAITAACLAWVMWGIDIGKVHLALGSVRWALFVPVIASYLVTHAVRVWRFKLLVGADISYRRMFAICALGFYGREFLADLSVSVASP